MRMRESLLVLCSHHVGWHQLLSSYLALTLELQLEILRENYKIKIHDYSIPQREGRVALGNTPTQRHQSRFRWQGCWKKYLSTNIVVGADLLDESQSHLGMLIICIHWLHNSHLYTNATLYSGSSLLSDLPLSYLTTSHNLIPHKISFTSIKYQT